MKRAHAGFGILVIVAGYLYTIGLWHGLSDFSPGSVFLGLGFLGLLTAYGVEGRALSAIAESSLGAADKRLFFSVVVGAMASYWLNIKAGLGAVVAAGLVSVLAALVFPSFSAAMTCGAFVGMASPVVLPGPLYFFLASTFSGLLYILAKDVMNGFGGKLGAMAAAGCTAAALLLGSELPRASVLDWSVGKYAVLVTLISAALSYGVSVNLGHGAVMGSGIVSVVGGLLLPALWPSFGAVLAGACACGSYAGMSSRERMPGAGGIIVAGCLAGLVFVFGAPALVGIGGRLGTTALGSVLAVWGLPRLYGLITGPRRKEGTVAGNPL